MDILAVTAAKEAGLMRLRTLLVGSAGMALVAAGGTYSLTLRSSMPAISPPEACRLIARQWNGGDSGGPRRLHGLRRSQPFFPRRPIQAFKERAPAFRSTSHGSRRA